MEVTPQLEQAYAQAVGVLWQRAAIDYVLHETQLKILALLEGSKQHRKFFFLCSRRLGKSYLLFWLAVRQCLQKPGSRVLFLAPWAKDAKDIATDIAAQVLEDCPKDIKPEFKGQDREFHFPNGSIIRLKGTNGEHAQFLRGTAADLIIIDECGLVDDLQHVVSDVCVPMTATTMGRIILASTPPRSPSHESATIYEDLAGRGAVAKFTIRDAPHIPYEEKVRILVEECHEDPNDVADILAGKKPAKSTTALRELFAEFVTDSDSAVIPEFTAQAEKEIVQEWKRPDYFDAYVSIDPGMRDRTGILFAYWDFVHATLVIEDEALLNHAGTPEIAKVLKEKEKALWGFLKPYIRVSDVDLRLIADLKSEHGIQVQKAKKIDLLGTVNSFRSLVQSRRIIIHPRCVNFRRQLKNAIWNNKATDLARADDQKSLDSHFDLVAAAFYLNLAVNKHKDPFPAYYYEVGQKFGPPRGSWISPKSRKKKPKSLGLYAETPLSRRLMKRAA